MRFIKRRIKRYVRRRAKARLYHKGKKIFNRAAKRAARHFVKVSRGGIRL